MFFRACTHLIKATSVLVAFSFLVEASELPENIKSAISESRSLLLKGERKQALNHLLQYIDDEKSKDYRSHLLKEAQKIATYFVTEKGQKSFELGESLADSNSSLAAQKFQESLSAEGENTKIMNSLSLLNLNKNNCAEAKKWNDRSQQAFPHSVFSRAISYQVLDCLNEFESITNKFNALSSKDPVFEIPSVQILLARSQIQSGEQQRGLTLLRQLATVDERYPDVWYWRWKLDPEKGQIQRDYLERYLKICKSITPRLKRVYRESGAICLKRKEAEAALKESGVDRDASANN